MAWLTVLGPLAEQVEYRLKEGAGCDGQAAEATADAVVDYRLDSDLEEGIERVGAGWARLGHAAGTMLRTEADRDTVRAVMAGNHPGTGETLVEAKTAVDPRAKLPAAPLVQAVQAVAEAAHTSPEALLGSAKRAKRWERLVNGLRRDGDAHRAPVRELEALAAAAGVGPEMLWEAGQLSRARDFADWRVRTGNRGYDLTLNIPKSVSALYGLADDGLAAAIESEYRAAVRETVAEFESWVAYGLSGHLGDDQVPLRLDGEGLIATITLHRSARPVGERVGDPHLHAHVMIANMVRCSDGQWRALVGRDLHRHTHAAGELLKARVRARLTARFGLTYTRSATTGEWEIAGVGEQVRTLFSARSQQVAAEVGADAPRAVAAAAARRTAQDKHGPAAQLSARDQWRRTATEAGIDPRRVVADALGHDPGTAPATGAGGPGPDVPDLEELVAAVWNPESGVTAHRKTVTRAHLLARVAAECPGGIAPNTLEALTDAVIAAGPAVALPETDPAYMSSTARMTSADIIAIEQRITERARAGLGAGRAHTRPDVRRQVLEALHAETGRELSAEQKAVVERLTGAGHAVDAVIGVMGGGKTTAMRAARRVWEQAGYRVAGAAPSAVAAATLQAESGIRARTVAGWLTDLERIDRRRTLPGGAHLRPFGGAEVLVVDEAAMADDRALDRLLTAAAEAGVKVVAIGDPKQLRPVGIGGAFAAIHRIVGGEGLSENWRQRDGADRRALEQWRAGGRTTALATWGQSGRVHTAEGAEQVRQAMVARWWADRRGIGDGLQALQEVVMLAARNADVEELNTAARALAREHGLLGDEEVRVRVAGGAVIALSEGDAVRIRRNDYRSRHSADPDVLNGYRGIVTGVDEHGVAVRWRQAGRIEQAVLSRAQIARGDLSHAYAATIASAQGQTCERAHVLGTGADAHALYPAMGRARARTDLYLDHHALESDADRVRMGEPATAAEQLNRAITAYGRTLADIDDGLVLSELQGLPQPAAASAQARPQEGPAQRAAAEQARPLLEAAQGWEARAAAERQGAERLEERARTVSAVRLAMQGTSRGALLREAEQARERAAAAADEARQARSRARTLHAAAGTGGRSAPAARPDRDQALQSRPGQGTAAAPVHAPAEGADGAGAREAPRPQAEPPRHRPGSGGG